MGEISGLCYSPNGEFIAASDMFTNSISVWDVQEGCKVHEFRSEEQLTFYQVQYSPDGSYIGVASYNGGADIWNLATGTLVAQVRGHDGKVEALCFSFKGEYLVTGGYDRQIKVWQVGTWNEIFTLSEISTIPEIAASSTESRIATGLHNGFVSVWDVSTRQRIRLIDIQESAVYALKFSPDGKHIATGGQDGVIRIHDIDSGECIFTKSVALRYPELDIRGSLGLNPEELCCLKARGAILDDIQAQIVKQEIQKGRELIKDVENIGMQNDAG